MQLYLNPIHAVVQLRTSMEFLKSGGSKRKASGVTNAEVFVKLEASNQDKSVGSSKKQVLFPLLYYIMLQSSDSIGTDNSATG